MNSIITHGTLHIPSLPFERASCVLRWGMCHGDVYILCFSFGNLDASTARDYEELSKALHFAGRFSRLVQIAALSQNG